MIMNTVSNQLIGTVYNDPTWDLRSSGILHSTDRQFRDYWSDLPESSSPRRMPGALQHSSWTAWPFNIGPYSHMWTYMQKHPYKFTLYIRATRKYRNFKTRCMISVFFSTKSLTNYLPTLHTIPEKRRSHVHRNGSLKTSNDPTCCAGQCVTISHV